MKLQPSAERIFDDDTTDTMAVPDEGFALRYRLTSACLPLMQPLLTPH